MPGLDRNQVTEQTLKRDLTKSTVIAESIEMDDEHSSKNSIEGSTQSLAYWFEKAINYGVKEILYWYHYSFEIENKVKNMTADGKIKEKTARSMIYKEMLKYLSNVTLIHFVEKTSKKNYYTYLIICTLPGKKYLDKVFR